VFLTSLHKNLLRLASLGLCTSVAHASRGATTRELAARYMALLTAKVPVDSNDAPRAVDYIRSRSLIRTYLRRAPYTASEVEAVAERGELRMELQDWYLSDRALQSSSGREREAASESAVMLCGELGLLRLPAGVLQTHGRVLVRVAEDLGVLPFEQPRANPFAPDRGYFVASYFHILRSDLPFTRALLAWIEPGREFAFASDLSARATEILDAVEGMTTRTAANRSLFQWLDRQKGFARRVSQQGLDNRGRKTSAQAVLRPIEDLLLPRLEFMVDIGVLWKPAPAEFVYQLTDPGERFRDAVLNPQWSVEERYFGTMADLMGRPVADEAVDYRRLLSGAYAALRNPAGYAPIEEAVVLTHSTSWGEGGPLPELSDTKDELGTLARTADGVRIVSDRHRRPGAFRMELDSA